ncbi:MAG TPA: LuxR C-terminal-related transcriptional regulator [Intrasporangium sp.]|nr:LuxR C-terminal-related transcriptional regulator [Intrasporangium sp.]
MGDDELAVGRQAYAHRQWEAAREHLTRADPATLGVADLRALSSAAYLTGDRNAAIRYLQQAHSIDVAAGDRLAAAHEAHWLAMIFSTSGEPAVGAGWVARAERLVEDESDDAAIRGHLLIHEMFRRLFSGDLAGMLASCERIEQIGRTRADPDLVTFALSSSGRALLYLGRVREGLARLDEAMVGLATGEVSPIMAGQIYCSMIEGCQEISDYERMTQWTEALTQWCDDQLGLVAFTGQCAVHRGQILRARASFPEALDELALAIERYRANGMDPAVGLAMYERGEVLRTLGDLEGAAAAYDEAATWGHEPQPGLSLLWLAHGRTGAAATSIRRVLDEARDPVARSRRLGPAVEILCAAGALDEAERASSELGSIAESFGCQAVTANAAYAAGLVSLARDDPAGSLAHLRHAWKAWIGLGARYEAALARVRIALALRALGDAVSATSELSVAQRTFAELGAEPARREVERLLATGLPDGLTSREVEVLRLVATGRSNAQIASALVLSEKTVARHLSNIFTKTGVTSRTAAATYAHGHDLA